MFTTRVYSGAATMAVGSALTRTATRESASKGETVWEWLARAFAGVEHERCSCSAKRAQAELECSRQEGVLDFDCEVTKDGVCLFTSTCAKGTTSRRGGG